MQRPVDVRRLALVDPVNDPLTGPVRPGPVDDTGADAFHHTPVAGVPLAVGPDGRVADTEPTGARSPRRPVLLALLATLVTVVGGGVALVLFGEDDPPPPKPDIPLDTWAPYWSLDDALPDLERRVGSMREVSPFWFNATGVDQIVIDPNAREGTEEFMRIVRDSDALLVPSIVDAMPAGGMAAILADPAQRALHVETIRLFAEEGDFDGIDIDYEQFAFADGRDTWAATRPNWVAFVAELGAALRADGRTLVVSIPPVYDAEQTPASGFWVYDYGAIAPHVDRIRIMAYDFSVGDPGPIAPLDFVRRSIEGAIAATGSPDKLVLGVPAYGRNWPIGTTGTCPEAELQGRTSVTARSVDDLVVLRDAVPVPVVETGEWTFEYDLEVTDGVTTCIERRRVHYVDGDGIRQRMDLAREYRLDGVSLWALGFEDDDVWDAILPTVAASTSSATPD